ncbi:MAG: peptide chain release factor N(5)-glutamine methyltransferase [Bacteroides sp.]|nr:peptide chain release factor N(5)-glutamine methyltransferase [Bacteroides sp.]MBQ8873832.1 peptide chain release factor N(5)-glutamine methyltransferase [Bacteroides sp.]
MHPVYHEIKKMLAGYYPDAEASALAKMLLVEVLHFSTLELFGGKDKEVFKKDLDVLYEMSRRLQNREPIQYIIGRETFCGMPFVVNRHVLIPRPETQDLVEWIAEEDQQTNPCRLLDMGTGSGCIAISLAKKLPHVQVEAWDISGEALQVARQNALNNQVKVDFHQQDILSASPGIAEWNVIVSNPPYITNKEKAEMEANVLNWEPHTALFVPDHDPLLFYRKIAQLGMSMLVDGGALYFEINRAYGTETIAMLQALGYENIIIRKDRFNNERMIKATRP